MKADAFPLLEIFEKKMRLEVPLFQRQYVWRQEEHWEPLWEDISHKFIEYIEGRKDTPVHFLGAMVVDQKQTPITHVEKRQIIDGQQRLTTFQIFLASLRDFCRVQECEEMAKECESFILNTGRMTDPEVDKFKVWPTQLDRSLFSDVITLGSCTSLEAKYPLTYRRRKPNPRPLMVEAYIFFYNQLSEFFLGTDTEPPIGKDYTLSARLDECFQALKNALHVVVIDLDSTDDAQVIFETLNARGEPLLPADLLRNFIFLRAARKGESQEELYDEYWRKFDDPFWRQEIKQGRLLRPRSDLFMQHFLTSRRAAEIPIKHLFVEYKFWIEKKHPFSTIREELATLARQGDDFRRIIKPKEDDTLFPFFTFLHRFEISTTYPLILFLLDSKISENELTKIAHAIEGYLLRRAACGYTTKNYNRIFLALLRHLQQNGTTFMDVRAYLSGLFGDSNKWPTDDDFFSAWQKNNAYYTLNNEKIVYILQRLNESYYGSKAEKIIIESSLTIEHILPQNWIENWPLPDGSKGMTWSERLHSQENDSRAVASLARENLLHTFGNLTILTHPLNASLSNSSWEVKKPEILRASLLPINQVLLYDVETWDENAIEQRSKELFSRAVQIWPGPSNLV